MPQAAAADPVADVLRSVELPAPVRRAAWQAFEDASNEDDLTARIKSMPLPQHIKRQLWGLKYQQAPQPAAPVAAPEPPAEAPRTWADTANDVVAGAAKEVGSQVAGLGAAVHQIPGVSRAVDAIYGQPGLSDQAFQVADQAMTATNTPQMVGKGLTIVAETALPVAKAIAAIPTRAKAGVKFRQVMSKAADVPVDLSETGTIALRIEELSKRGGVLPKVVRDFITYATDPKKPPMDYRVLRDFATNVSRLSRDEFNKLTPILKQKLSELRVAVNKAAGEAAGTVGQRKTYDAAMREFAQAAHNKRVAKRVGKQVLKYGAQGGLLGVGGAAGYKLARTLGIVD